METEKRNCFVFNTHTHTHAVIKTIGENVGDVSANIPLNSKKWSLFHFILAPECASFYSKFLLRHSSNSSWCCANRYKHTGGGDQGGAVRIFFAQESTIANVISRWGIELESQLFVQSVVFVRYGLDDRVAEYNRPIKNITDTQVIYVVNSCANCLE